MSQFQGSSAIPGAVGPAAYDVSGATGGSLPFSSPAAEASATGASSFAGLDLAALAGGVEPAGQQKGDSTEGGAGQLAPTPDLARDAVAQAAKAGGDERGEFSMLTEQSHVEAPTAANDNSVTDLRGAPDIAALQQPPRLAAGKEIAPPLERPLGHPGWSQDLGERVVWMTGKGLQTAEIRLNPVDLGPLEVRINMQQDQASVQFVSHHAAVREAIESALPKLREMMSAQQLNLMDVNVSQQSFADQHSPQNPQFAFDRQAQHARPGQVTSGAGNDVTVYPEPEQPVMRQAGRGLLNIYA